MSAVSRRYTGYVVILLLGFHDIDHLPRVWILIRVLYDVPQTILLFGGDDAVEGDASPLDKSLILHQTPVEADAHRSVVAQCVQFGSTYIQAKLASLLCIDCSDGMVHNDLSCLKSHKGRCLNLVPIDEMTGLGKTIGKVLGNRSRSGPKIYNRPHRNQAHHHPHPNQPHYHPRKTNNARRSKASP